MNAQRCCIFLFAALLAPASAAIVTFERPGMDVWMYENGFDRGFRENAPVFAGPVGVNGSDDRLGQLVLGWDLAAFGIPAGLGAASYSITRVTLRATHVNDQVFDYDPSYDSYRTYLPSDDPEFLNDVDTGRPLELHGLGLRNGFTQLSFVGGAISGSFSESTPSFASGVGEHTRHAFARSPGTPRGDGDVSENVTGRFESRPFAIGQTASLSPGESVPADTEFTFNVNLADPAIHAYIREAMDSGQLGLTLDSLHPSSFGGVPGPQGYPRWYTRDYFDFVPEVVPWLEIEYAIIPEPAAVSALLLGAFTLAARRRRTR